MKIKHRTHPFAVPAVIVVTLSIFFVWILSVVVPVAVVELTYDYHKILSDFFNVTDIRGLLIPQFRVDLKGYTSTYTYNGITIPSLFIDEPVIYNVDPNDQTAYLAALKKGIAHASGSGFPGTGGLGYYFAHSSTPAFVAQYNAVFYLLGKINIGDEIYIWHEGTRFDYRVFSKYITDPTDLTFLHTKYDTETVVLQTCWPPGTSLKRLLVFGSLEQH